MTDNKSIKALETCAKNRDTDAYCHECPYCDDGYCLDKMIADALDLINRQKAEIERLQNGIAISQKETNRFTVVKCGRGFGKQLFFNELVKATKAEAIKEFAERLKAVLFEDYWGDDCWWFEGKFDRLVKEMVGGDNDS